MSRGSESIKELRKICQESRYENEGGMPWFERNFYRRFSIYFTKVFLKTGMSANQVTVIGALIGLIAGLFLAFANPLYWIIGVLFFYLEFIMHFTISPYSYSDSGYIIQFVRMLDHLCDSILESMNCNSEINPIPLLNT